MGTGFKLDTEWVEWPNKELWAKVQALYFGTPADGPKDPVIEVVPKKQPTKTTPKPKVAAKATD